MELYPKDPNEVVWLGWTWDIAPHTLESSTWEVPDGITGTDASYTGTDGILDVGDGTTQIKVSGGTAGQVYDLVNRVTTSNGETFDDTIRVYILES